IAANPDSIGIGLGEDTGVVITGGDHLETIGSGQVIIFDGHELQHTNIADVDEGEALSIEHMVVHIIAKGYHYNVRERAFFAPLKVES
ncbi:MAG: cyanophycinase, partial [Flavobacteriales bacterium]|nr:cyanophycinase [Flavobacteriales bacterium]